MKKLTVFYDPHCGLCTRFRDWLLNQALWLPVEFIGFDTAEAGRRFPGLLELGADRECIVQADDGGWWQGADAWLICLWTTRRYRIWSHCLAAPRFRPFLKTIVQGISENRIILSRLLKLGSEGEIHAALKPLECKSGSCQLPHLVKAKEEGVAI